MFQANSVFVLNQGTVGTTNEVNKCRKRNVTTTVKELAQMRTKFAQKGPRQIADFSFRIDAARGGLA